MLEFQSKLDRMSMLNVKSAHRTSKQMSSVFLSGPGKQFLHFFQNSAQTSRNIFKKGFFFQEVNFFLPVIKILSLIIFQIDKFTKGDADFFCLEVAGKASRVLATIEKFLGLENKWKTCQIINE
jgi:hypothetical protein